MVGVPPPPVREDQELLLGPAGLFGKHGVERVVRLHTLVHPEPRHDLDRELQDDAQAAEAGASGEQVVSTVNRFDDGLSAGAIARELHTSYEAGEAGVAGAVSRGGGGTGDRLPRDGPESREAER